jgi:hypothetical protein
LCVGGGGWSAGGAGCIGDACLCCWHRFLEPTRPMVPNRFKANVPTKTDANDITDIRAAQQHELSVFWVPRRSVACEKLLEDEGVTGELTQVIS